MDHAILHGKPFGVPLMHDKMPKFGLPSLFFIEYSKHMSEFTWDFKKNYNILI
jgi:hypothetical protein